MTTLLTPAQIKPKSFESRRSSFFTRDGCASCLRACLGARLFLQSCYYPNLSEGADRVGGQQRGDKEYSFSGVTKSGRVWRRVPENDARSVWRRVPESDDRSVDLTWYPATDAVRKESGETAQIHVHLHA